MMNRCSLGMDKEFRTTFQGESMLVLKLNGPLVVFYGTDTFGRRACVSPAMFSWRWEHNTNFDCKINVGILMNYVLCFAFGLTTISFTAVKYHKKQ